jgi:hypothetical protein
MIKLTTILKEITIQEKIVKVPQEALAKSKEIYDYIQQNLEKLKQKGKGKPYVDPKFKNAIKLKDLRGNDVSVSIGVYDNKSDRSEALMDPNGNILSINLAHLSDYSTFEDHIEHELVHAMDPKVSDPRVLYGDEKGRGGIAKKGADPVDDGDMYTKYIKSPWEFDAFTAPLINKVSAGLNKMGDQKKTYQQLLTKLFSDIRTKSLDDILQIEAYIPLAWIFTKRDWTEENWGAAWNDYATELSKMQRWATKPTLYKRFLKRVGTEL